MKINYYHLFLIICCKLLVSEVLGNFSDCKPSIDICKLNNCIDDVLNHSTVCDQQKKYCSANQKQSPTILPLVTLGEKSYYFATNLMAPWQSASDFCRLNNMKLVKIETESENKIITRYLRGIVPGGNYWIAATDLGDEGNFFWANDGEAVSAYNWTVNPWSTKQPDNYNNIENCVEIWATDYKWNDNVCKTYKNFICELCN